METGGKGLCHAAAPRLVGPWPLVPWVLEAMLSDGADKPRPPAALPRALRLFPFELAPPPPAELEARPAFEVFHHGLDHEILIRPAGTAPSRDAEGRA